MKDKALSAWLRLCLIPGLSNKNILNLLQQVGTAEEIFSPIRSQLTNADPDVLRLIKHCQKYIFQSKINQQIERALHWRQQENQHIITVHSDAYPPL